MSHLFQKRAVNLTNSLYVQIMSRSIFYIYVKETYFFKRLFVTVVYVYLHRFECNCIYGFVREAFI